MGHWTFVHGVPHVVPGTQVPTGLLVDGVLVTGGGGAGGAVVYQTDFAFDTPGLDAGIEVYTPAIGDLLLDVQVFPSVLFDGTTPLFDCGSGAGPGTGLFGNNFGIRPDLALLPAPYGGVNTGLQRCSLSAVGVEFAVTGSAYPWSGVFTTTDPLLVWVTQDGTKGGTPIGGATGAASVYVVVARPVAP